MALRLHLHHPFHPAVGAEPRAEARKVGSHAAADLTTAALLFALGLLVLVACVRMGIGWGSDGPESGFVPFWLSVVLLGSLLTIIVRAVRRASDEPFATRGQLACVLKVLVPTGAMIALIAPLGLYVAGALYMCFSMRWNGRYSWLASTALPLGFTALTFLVFERWFLVPLPKGPLEAWLGY